MAAPDLIGLDLAGPTNRDDTALCAAHRDDDGFTCRALVRGLDDVALRAHVDTWADDVVVGLDAPLSYQPGGGDRAGDRALRRLLRERELPGAVMTPTMTRMVYLTLRGLAVARLVRSLRPRARIVEVHPGAHLALHGAPPDAVAAMKREASARGDLMAWLRSHGARELPADAVSDHEVAAVAAARGAWTWAAGAAIWCAPADPPLHPFDYCA